MLPSLSGLTLRHPVVDTGPQAIAPGTKNTRDGSAYGAISLQRLRPGTPAWQLHVFVPDNDVKDAAGNVVQKGTRVEVEHYYNIDTLAQALEHKTTSPTSRYEVVPLDRLRLLRAANRWRRQNGQRLLLVDFPRWVYAQDAVQMDMKSFGTKELDNLLLELGTDIAHASKHLFKTTDEYKGMVEQNRLHRSEQRSDAEPTPPPFHGELLRNARQAMWDAERHFKALREQWNFYSNVDRFAATSGLPMPRRVPGPSRASVFRCFWPWW